MDTDLRNAPPQLNRNSALFLDVDGTLLDIAPIPSAVEVPPGLLETLNRLNDILEGAMALISGRAIADLDRIFGPLAIAVAGQHGAEIRSAGKPVLRFSIQSARLPEIAVRLAEFVQTHPRIVVEAKGLAVAAHYRAAPEHRAALYEFLTRLLAERHDGLEILEGHKVFEIKPASVSKGAAVAHFMEQPSFAARMPIFLGDDRTDEDGFAVALRLGGAAIWVGSESRDVARWRLPNPAAVRRWLENSIAAIRAD